MSTLPPECWILKNLENTAPLLFRAVFSQLAEDIFPQVLKLLSLFMPHFQRISSLSPRL